MSVFGSPRVNSERYLDDGLYASYDGYQILLRAPRVEGDHYIALEPGVYESLLAFVADLKPPRSQG